MDDHPETPATVPPSLAPFADRWLIQHGASGLDVWTAERDSADGRHIRYIVGRTIKELADKLHAAETCEP
jgi:predicted component of type VI protein secretion system